jgi:hypothetical protein
MGETYTPARPAKAKTAHEGPSVRGGLFSRIVAWEHGLVAMILQSVA